MEIANAVSRIDNLEFLSDVIPRTTTYKKFVEQRGKNFKPGDSVSATKAAAGGQTELSFMSGGSKPHVDILHPAEGTNGKGNSTEPEVIEDDGEDEDEMDVDEEYKASGGAIEDDIQEQLAMEMGHHTTTNGR
jgi:DNA polymerase epsilon subunit 4